MEATWLKSMWVRVIAGIIAAATVSFGGSYLGNATAQVEMRKDIAALQDWQREVKEWQKDLRTRELVDAELRGQIIQRLTSIESVLTKLSNHLEKRAP